MMNGKSLAEASAAAATVKKANTKYQFFHSSTLCNTVFFLLLRLSEFKYTQPFEHLWSRRSSSSNDGGGGVNTQSNSISKCQQSVLFDSMCWKYTIFSSLYPLFVVPLPIFIGQRRKEMPVNRWRARAKNVYKKEWWWYFLVCVCVCERREKHLCQFILCEIQSNLKLVEIWFIYTRTLSIPVNQPAKKKQIAKCNWNQLSWRGRRERERARTDGIDDMVVARKYLVHWESFSFTPTDIRTACACRSTMKMLT